MNSNSNHSETCNEAFLDFLHTQSASTCIAGLVASNALEYHDPATFFQDLSCHGCVSGMVGELIYYADTHAFFDQHYSEIQELKEEWEDATGQTLQISGDIKNFLAWFAFEEIANRMAVE